MAAFEESHKLVVNLWNPLNCSIPDGYLYPNISILNQDTVLSKSNELLTDWGTLLSKIEFTKRLPPLSLSIKILGQHSKLKEFKNRHLYPQFERWNIKHTYILQRLVF